MPAPCEISQLVELFERNYDQYRAPAFTEAAVRHQFIDPLFSALGWDVNNTQGFAEQYKEVIHEDRVTVAGAAKAPDYAFRIGKERKFFVEAKKPAVNIQYDIEPAYQLRRYAWSAKLPLSILTDFEEFSVYDCRSKPAASDKASAGRILFLNYKEYVTRWDEIAGVFGKPAVWQGALDKYAEAKAGKRGTAQVDDEFLAEIERWRELLARNLVLRNPTLRGSDVNWAVQQIIDRIVFLRICESRDLETFEQLRALLNGGRTSERLQEIFLYADRRYNSGLFHFEQEKDRAEPPDTLTLGLVIDDKVLKDIIEHLYYPQSPYEFSVLPADILGHVYERFLGKVIRLTPGRQVKIEEKPEVRKAGGVYYTPTYIVDYIVRQTVGPLLEGKTPAQIGGAGGGRGGVTPPLRIADIACGSGSFLLGAYQFLLDWHLAEYLKDPDRWLKGKRPPLERAAGGTFRLSIEERKRILMNNIYGVDIDPQAVEVTKLSLLLKVLEGEGVVAQMSFLPERVLPDLGRNIKCGNSLIGPDFYEGKLALPDEDTARRVNAFDWQPEFPEAMAAGGFDAVIGNPPYVNIENISLDDRAYLVRVFGENGKLGKRYDIYQVFVLKGISLLREWGRLGFILPNTFLMGHSYAVMRKSMVQKTAIHECVDLPSGVFQGVTVDNVLIFLERQDHPDYRRGNLIQVNKLGSRGEKRRILVGEWDEVFLLPQAEIEAAEDCKINVHANPDSARLFSKLESVSVRLGKITDSSQGIILYKTAEDAARSKYTGFSPQEGWRRLLRGKNIGRYETNWGGEYVNYGPWLWCARDERYFSSPKILLHAMRNKSLARRLVGTYDSEQYYNAHNLANIVARRDSGYDLRYILGLFNSALLNFWYKHHFPNVNINPSDFRQLPIRTIDFTDPAALRATTGWSRSSRRCSTCTSGWPRRGSRTRRPLCSGGSRARIGRSTRWSTSCIS